MKARSYLVPGDRAPDFELQNQHRETVRLRDYRGRKLLIYFYPLALSVDCTRQACDLRDHRADFSLLGLDVVGISPDPPEMQREFDSEHGLKFPLLFDEDHKVADSYRTWGESTYKGESITGIIRSSFLVAKEGRIEQVWSPIKAEETVLKALEALAGRN